jgi:DNA end-binding protein Ku
MFPATSTEGTIAFRMIHEPSGRPINYLKGVETESGFKEVPEEEIIKGYEHTEGHHVLIKRSSEERQAMSSMATSNPEKFVRSLCSAQAGAIS